MYNHAPDPYTCPFCLVIQGVEGEKLLTRQSDIFYRDNDLIAFIPAHCWENNHGNAIIIPTAHYENLYDLPNDLGAKVFALSKRVVLAMKSAYGCPGTSIRQHNEPAGNQDVWHYHLHVFPRYHNDQLYRSGYLLAPPDERARYAEQLRKAINPG